MGSIRSIRTSGTVRQHFIAALIGSAVLAGAVGRIWGEDIALKLQETPTTTPGWLFIGWLVAAPPCVIALMTWHERDRLSRRAQYRAAWLFGAWIGLSMFIWPAKLDGVDSQFGTGALVGDPLSTGWAWGALANLVGLGFTGLVLTVLHKSVPDGPNAAQRDLTARFLERAWLVLLVVSLGFALYGKGAGIFDTTT